MKQLLCNFHVQKLGIFLVDTSCITTAVGRGVWGREYVESLADEGSMYGAQLMESDGRKFVALESWQQSRPDGEFERMEGLSLVL